MSVDFSGLATATTDAFGRWTGTLTHRGTDYEIISVQRASEAGQVQQEENGQTEINRGRRSVLAENAPDDMPAPSEHDTWSDGDGTSWTITRVRPMDGYDGWILNVERHLGRETAPNYRRGR